jgi:hypothetical protein
LSRVANNKFRALLSSGQVWAADCAGRKRARQSASRGRRRFAIAIAIAEEEQLFAIAGLPSPSRGSENHTRPYPGSLDDILMNVDDNICFRGSQGVIPGHIRNFWMAH